MTTQPTRQGGREKEMDALQLSDKQLQTLRHMLGIDTPWDREPKPYRDYFAAEKGNQELAELARLGMVRLYRDDTYDWYATTPAGKAAAMASHKRIRYSKAKRVYGKFLDISDCFDITFKQFLTDPQYAETRRLA